ncbi:ParB/RepB/Spo0J family partition protein [Glutamicibacter sp. PS]|uniref:ParB/RepB/Spo0J family partition protein n=1 Tax=Glutamicibacter sp. PS TaxID=3075634 RepID=UPI00283D6AF4|nr:ParB/RepB/Spo0J family partition protein [Glutamicibacter sp. PS]MDR4533234.1 ParB/RepB/Spo0J family partition protein [Glutamicibacter sp. PS]
MSKNHGEIQELPLSAVHPDPDNPRKDMGDLDRLAKELKAIGQMDPITVYEHPDLEGQYRIQGGHRRYQAALRADLATILCRIIPTPATPKADLYAEALTTGTNHAPLSTTEQGVAIQGMLTEGKSEAWIARNFAIPKAEVKARAGLGKRPQLAAKHDTGKLDLLGVAKLMEYEEKTGATDLVEHVTSEIAVKHWVKYGAADVEREIALAESAAKKAKIREEMTGFGAEELASEHRYSGKYRKTDKVLSHQEHIAAGHLYEVDESGVTWWEKLAKSAPRVDPVIAARKEMIRRLNGVLPAAQRARRAFTIEKIRDKQALADIEDRLLFAQHIMSQCHTGALCRAVGEVISLASPEPEGDEQEYLGSLSKRRDEWRVKAEGLVMKLTLGQQIRLYLWLQQIEAEEESYRFNWYDRGSWEKRNRWRPLAVWYNRLIQFFGYIPDSDEVAAINLGRELDTEGPNVEAYNVDLPAECEQVCGRCGQQSIAHGQPGSPCPTCESEGKA